MIAEMDSPPKVLHLSFSFVSATRKCWPRLIYDVIVFCLLI